MITNAPGRLNAGNVLVGVAVTALIAVQGIVVVAAKSERWAGNWASTSAALGWATIWGCCIISAATAWLISTARRNHYEHLITSSSRSPFAIYRAPLATVTAGGVLGYAVVLVYLALTTGPKATHGRLSPIEMAGATASVALALGLGSIIGRSVPARLAPIAAAIAPYVVYTGLTYFEAYSGNALFSDLSLSDLVDRTYLSLPPELLLGRAVFWAAGGLALVLLSLKASRVAYTAALIASFGLSAVMLTAGTRFERSAEFEAVCFAGSPEICVDRAHEHLADQYVSRIRTNAVAIPGLDLSGTSVTPIDRLAAGGGPAVLLVPIVKRNTSPAHEIETKSLDAAFGAALFLDPCLREATENAETQLTDGFRTAVTLYLWWLKARALPVDGSNYPGEMDVRSILEQDPELETAVAKFGRLSPSGQTSWVAENQGRISGCQATSLP